MIYVLSRPQRYMMYVFLFYAVFCQGTTALVLQAASPSLDDCPRVSHEFVRTYWLAAAQDIHKFMLSEYEKLVVASAAVSLHCFQSQTWMIS